MADSFIPILSDHPAEEDAFNFTPYAETLAQIIGNTGTVTPLTIGIFGKWGRGKTSLMRMVRRRLEHTLDSTFPVHSVWFNAWLYNHEEALWRALIAQVVEGTRKFGLSPSNLATLGRLESRLYRAAETSGDQLTIPPGWLPGVETLSHFSRTSLELLRRRAERRADGRAAEEIQTLIDDVEESYATSRRDAIVGRDVFRREFETLARRWIEPHGRLVVFVDDLDRCLPDKAVEVLEAVKLFLDVPGLVFVLGVDRSVIEEGIRVRYRDYDAQIDGTRYLEKIIQLPFNLPAITSQAIERYVRTTMKDNLPDPRCEQVFSVGLEPNPRRIKRTLNVFSLLWQLAQNREDLRERITPVRLAKIVAIQQYCPRLFALLVEGPHYLIDLERRFWAEDDRNATAGETEDAVSAGPLQEFLSEPFLKELLTCTAEDESDANFSLLTSRSVREYVYLTHSTVDELARENRRITFEPVMVSIHAGRFMMGTQEQELDALAALGVNRTWLRNEMPQHDVVLNAYAISRYPVTRAEYARFVEDGGYEVQDYWTEAGWQQRVQEGWLHPRAWDGMDWSDATQPVAGVSWYEAFAYCRWLSVRSGRTYRLPTEAEWEKAARGTDGRRYPWGNVWNPAIFNHRESSVAKTTPVGQYPQADSPYGVGEMVGQVWEWCSTRHALADGRRTFKYPYHANDGRENEEGSDPRILRGGPWWADYPAAKLRCSYRYWGNPGAQNPDWGFRCVLMP